MDTYMNGVMSNQKNAMRAVVTGKPVACGGSLGTRQGDRARASCIAWWSGRAITT